MSIAGLNGVFLPLPYVMLCKASQKNTNLGLPFFNLKQHVTYKQITLSTGSPCCSVLFLRKYYYSYNICCLAEITSRLTLVFLCMKSNSFCTSNGEVVYVFVVFNMGLSFWDSQKATISINHIPQEKTYL